MYEVSEVVTSLDRGLGWILLFSAFGWIGGSIQFFEGLRLTWRDGVIGHPLGYVMLVFAHDAYFVIHSMTGGETLDHWYFDATNVLFLIWPFVEVVAVIWLVRVARREFAPDLAPASWYFICAIYLSLAIVIYTFMQSIIDDPLLILSWTYAQVVNIVFMIPLILRRRSTLGQSRIMAWALLLSPGSMAMFIAPSLAPSLLGPAYIAMAGLTFTLSASYLALYEYYRRRELKGMGPLAAL